MSPKTTHHPACFSRSHDASVRPSQRGCSASDRRPDLRHLGSMAFCMVFNGSGQRGARQTGSARTGVADEKKERVVGTEHRPTRRHQRSTANVSRNMWGKHRFGGPSGPGIAANFTSVANLPALDLRSAHRAGELRARECSLRQSSGGYACPRRVDRYRRRWQRSKPCVFWWRRGELN